MALNFPSSPTNGQSYTSNGVTYTYDSTYGVWKVNPIAVPDVFSTANAGFTVSNSAFGVANAAFGLANGVSTNTTAAFALANGVSTNTTAAFGFANGVSTNTTAAFGFANGVSTNTTAAFAKANAALANTTSVFNGSLTIANSLKETRVAMGASDINLSSGNYFTKTISGTTTLTVSNVPSSGTATSFILDLTNGGSATVNWWSGTKWVGGTTPTLTSSGRDVLGFFTHDGGTTWSGFVIGKDVK